MKIEHWDANIDGPLREETLWHKLERRGYCVSRYVYPPGTRFPAHKHSVDKIDGVLKGYFKLEAEGETVILGPGDLAEVPRGVLHFAEVVGDEVVVSLDAARIR